MNPDSATITIHKMKSADLDFAAECTASEGWLSEDRQALEGFFRYDPKGCLIAEENGGPVGICFATSYGNTGFIGELIVHPEARGRGVGAKLLQHGMQLLQDRGAVTIYLDGVLKAVGLYERNGFRKVCRSWRFSGRLAGEESPHVRLMKASDLDQVFRLDEESFGADRSFFLQRRFELFPHLSLVQAEGTMVTGYISGRCGAGWVSAGPWIVAEGTSDPRALLQAFACRAGNIPINLGILDSNSQACDLVRSVGFVEQADSPWRMALGPSTDLGASPACFAVGSAAKG